MRANALAYDNNRVAERAVLFLNNQHFAGPNDPIIFTVVEFASRPIGGGKLRSSSASLGAMFSKDDLHWNSRRYCTILCRFVSETRLQIERGGQWNKGTGSRGPNFRSQSVLARHA